MLDFTMLEKIYLMPGRGTPRSAYSQLENFVKSSMVFEEHTITAYLFVNRNSNIITILYWDTYQFAKITYSLSEGRFKWPRTESKFMEVQLNHIQRLLVGDTLEPSIKAPNFKIS